MTDQERQQLKTELMEEIKAEINSNNLKIKDTTVTALATVRGKWFRCDNKKDRYSGSVMGKIFDVYTFHKVWQLTHKLTCYICGENRINNLKDTDFANYAADKLCQTIYDLRVEYLKNKFSLVHTHKGIGIYALRVADPSKGDEMGYRIDSLLNDLSNSYNTIQDAIDAIDKEVRN